MAEYREIYDRAQSDVASFWMEAASAIDWQKRQARLWTPPASLPPLVSRRGDEHLSQRRRRHVAAGRGDQKAVIYDSPITATRFHELFELQQATARFAGMLAGLA